MPNHMWFNKKPGQLPCNEEEHAILFSTDHPDVVRLPLELGGQIVKVLNSFIALCPVRRKPCRHLELENGMFVAESDQFYWYKPKQYKKPE